MTDAVQGWPFLVARGRRAGYRTVMAPAFLVAEDRHHVLATSTGVRGLGADGTGLVDVVDDRVGALGVGYTSERVMGADVDAGRSHADATGSDAGDVLRDEHGRPLEIIYGIVARAALQAPLDRRDLELARRHALASYRRFLAEEDRPRVDTAEPFELRTPIRAGPPARGLDAPPPVPPPGPARRRRRSGIVVAAAAAIGALLIAAGTVLVTASSAPEDLTVYSSLPLDGAQRARSQEIIAGMMLALSEADGRAAKFNVRYVSLNSARGGSGAWSREAVGGNARRAAADGTAAAYIGELSSAASAVSIPILSRAEVPQISPSNTAVGLTSRGPGAGKGEPEAYYRGGARNYVRIVPRDTVQGEALASAMRQDRCRRVAIAHAVDPHARGLERILRRSIASSGMRLVVDAPVIQGSAGSQRSLAAAARRRHADCAVFSGATARGAVLAFDALARALPRARLYGPGCVADRAFTDEASGGLPGRVAARVRLTLPSPGRDASNAARRRFYEAFARRHPGARTPGPYAIYGYEAMKLALSAIARSGTGRRGDVVKALFGTRDRRSVIGTYSIDAHGDTTLATYGLFAIRDGELVLDRRIRTTS